MTLAAMATKLMRAVQYNSYGGGASGLKVPSLSTCFFYQCYLVEFSHISFPAVIFASDILLTA